MRDSRRPLSFATFAGVLLLVLGAGCWGLFGFTNHREAHSYAGAGASARVTLTAGKTYSLGTRAGVRGEAVAGVDPGTLVCVLTPIGRRPISFTLTPDQTDTKAIHQIATFVSPLSGRARVTCPGLSDVFVDNADDAPIDLSGFWLLLATASLAVGAALVLSAVRTGELAGPGADHDDDGDEDDLLLPRDAQPTG